MTWLRRLRETPVTLGLIVANLAVFAVMVLASHRLLLFNGRTLIAAGASVAGPGTAASHWRWLTAAFVHTGLPHILLNLWVLGQIGIISEAALGRGLVAAAYVFTGVIGNAASALLADARAQPLISAGASGAIMGLIGMAATYAWLSGQRAAARVLAFNVLFILGIGLSLSVGGVRLVDNAAHVGGLCAGIVLGLVRVRRARPLPRWLDALLIGGSLALTVIAFAIVLLAPFNPVE
jgi:rhomboid protease GluP